MIFFVKNATKYYFSVNLKWSTDLSEGRLGSFTPWNSRLFHGAGGHGLLKFFYLKREEVLLKKNASETERAWSFDEVKRSEVERQAAVSSPGKLTAVFRSGTSERYLGGKIDRVAFRMVSPPFCIN
ncbi:hypothetical protein JW879_07385 [candidate division WOR-3 bacterium]|nr:hypothetical protein [candidate division WOR-3 bacterium]